MHEQSEDFEKKQVEDEAEEDLTRLPLANERDEAEVRRDLREARGDKGKLEQLVKESEAIIVRGKSPSSISRRDSEIIRKHERRGALASALLRGEHVEELEDDAAKEAARAQLLEEVKKTNGLDALRELAEAHIGAWDAGLSARMVLFASNDPRARGRYIATIEGQVYEMTKDPHTDPLKLLEKKYQLAYAKDIASKE